MLRNLLITAVLATSGFAITACEDEPDEPIEEQLEDIGDGMEDAADDVGDAAEDAADDVEDAVDG